MDNDVYIRNITYAQIWLMPYERNPRFTGRKTILHILREKLLDQNPKQYSHRIVLYGMGGIGKTQIALAYVYAHKTHYEKIFWITAVDQASLFLGYHKIAEIAGLEFASDSLPVDIAKAVIRWLRRENNWLLVIDNLDIIEIVNGFLPENGPQRHTIITSRNPNSLGIPAEGLEVPLLDVADAIDLLSTLSNIDIVTGSPESAEAAQIVQELGYLPLAIEQAAAYVREVAGNFANFIDEYHNNHKDVHEWIPQEYRSYSHSVATTWFMSFNVVRKNHSQAVELFRILSFLNPDGILIDFLQAGINGFSDDLRRLISSRIDLSKALIELERFSLLKWNRLGKMLVIHRLVQNVIRDELSEEERTNLCNTVVDVCDEAFPKEWNNDTRSFCRIYFGQILRPLLSIKSVQTMKLADIMARVGDFLLKDGKYNDGGELLKLVVKIRSVLSGADDPDTVTSMHNLAWMYQLQGKLPKAAKMQEDVLVKRKVILGEDHPDTITSMHTLACTYQLQGKLPEAAKMQEDVLAKYEMILGEDHPDTIASMHTLAWTYQLQGKLPKAAKMQKDVLAKRKVILGADDPDTVTSMHNLAWMYQLQGKLPKAAKMQEDVLAKIKVILGEDHPYTISSVHNLAWMYQLQGKLPEAAKMQEDVLAKYKVILGEDHPDTITSMHNMAWTYQLQGKLPEAAKMQEDVLAKYKVILGEDHPDTVTSMAHLATMYRLQGKLLEAVKMQEDVLAKRKVIFGEDHPHTVTSMANLASTYQLQGKLPEGTKMQEDVLAKHKVILGEDHPDTVTTIAHLA